MGFVVGVALATAVRDHNWLGTGIAVFLLWFFIYCDYYNKDLL